LVVGAVRGSASDGAGVFKVETSLGVWTGGYKRDSVTHRI